VAIPETLRDATKTARGLMVTGVATDSPAAKGGILGGDIIVALDGAALNHPGRLAEQLGHDSIGRSLSVQLVRAGVLTTVAVIPTARPEA